MSTPTLIMTKGLPGSGKTTWTKAIQALDAERGKTVKRINKDDLRTMLDDGKWSKERECFVLDARDSIVQTALLAGYDVIVDDTNLAPKHEQALRALAESHMAKFRVQDFTHVPLKECIANDLKRPASVGEKVIKSMYRQFLAPPPVPTPAHRPGLPSAIICDLDGTLAHLNGRNPYDASTCLNDGINEALRSALKDITDRGRRIVFVSGRQEKDRENTLRWLYVVAELPVNRLLMRPTGDTRPDAVVKREIYERDIAPYYNVLYVFDDRNSVVEMWRSLGLTCFQVADGDF